MDQTVKPKHEPLQLRYLVETWQNEHLSLIVNEIFSRAALIWRTRLIVNFPI